MSQHIKSLFNQLHPLFNSAATPYTSSSSTTTPKILVKLLNGKKISSNEPESVTKTTNPNHADHASDESIISSQCQSPLNKKIKQNPNADLLTDSGLEQSSLLLLKSEPKPASNKCKCSTCTKHAKRAGEILKKLKLAYTNSSVRAGKTNTELFYANIPLLIVKSFKPSASNFNKLEIRKGSAVNALFISDTSSRWIYVKDSNEQKGFIPKKCCEPFASRSCLNTKNRRGVEAKAPKLPKVNPPPLPLSVINQNINKNQERAADHTYMTITEADLINNTNKKASGNDTVEFCDVYDQTDLSLFSVSRILGEQNETQTNKTKKKSLFYSEDSCTSSCKSLSCSSASCSGSEYDVDATIRLSPELQQSEDILKLIKSNKSRNRKVSIALDKLSINLTMLEQKQRQQAEYIELRETSAENNNINNNAKKIKLNNKLINNYDDLFNFESTTTPTQKAAKKQTSDYDFLVDSSPYMSAGLDNNKEKMSRVVSDNNEDNHYDVLMAYKSTGKNKNGKELYVNLGENLSTPKPNLYKVVEDYDADFKGDLSVSKGDLVYLIENASNKASNNDWIFVRLYKRVRTVEKKERKHKQQKQQQTVYENFAENQILQGYIPRSRVVKV